MSGLSLHSDLLVIGNGHRYVIRSSDGVVEIRASLRAMWALRRELLHGAGLRPLFDFAWPVLQRCSTRISYRFGPFGLSILRPGGPTWFARRVGLR
jgi:hypothetical protein